MQVVKCNDYPARSPAQVVLLGSRTSIAAGSHTEVVMQGYELVVLFGVTVKGQEKVEVVQTPHHSALLYPVILVEVCQMARHRQDTVKY